MARLVKGSTDLLQPINLLPNSDFSRSGGYPSTQTIASPTNGTQYTFAQNWGFLTWTNNLSNIIITVSQNSVRIQGHVKSAITNIEFFVIYGNSTIYENDKKIFTGTFKVSGTTQYITNTHGMGSGNTVGYYNSWDKIDSNTYRSNYVFRSMVYSSNYNAYIILRLTMPAGSDFDFTFSDVCLYEGAYTNPPTYKSLDVQPSNQFILTDNSNSRISSANEIRVDEVFTTGGNWLRLFLVDRNFSSVHPINREGYITILHDNGTYRYRYYIAFVNSYGSGQKLFSDIKYLCGTSFLSGEQPTFFTKFRLAGNTTNGLFFEGYLNPSIVSGSLTTYNVSVQNQPVVYLGTTNQSVMSSCFSDEMKLLETFKRLSKNGNDDTIKATEITPVSFFN